jgi:hypothetical protein
MEHGTNVNISILLQIESELEDWKSCLEKSEKSVSKKEKEQLIIKLECHNEFLNYIKFLIKEHLY